MASAKQLASGSWRVQAKKKIDGKTIVKSFTVSPKDCGGDWRKAKKQAELLASEWSLNAEAEIHKVTVKKALELYIEGKKPVWSPSSYKDYCNMPKHFESIWDMDIKDVDSRTLQGLINLFSSKGLSNKTMVIRHNFITAALGYNGIDKRFRVVIPKTVKPELLPPEPSEMKRLLALASPEEKLTIILAGLYTLRRGEIGGLCGEDLLWDMHSIYVHTSKVKDVNKQWVRRPMPKNLKSVRRIEIDPEIMELFPHVGPKEYVISFSPDAITRRFERLRKKAGATCRFHDLRKHAASIRSEIMPGKYIEADGGWANDSNIMQSVYNKPFKEKRKEYSKKMNEQIMADYGKELFG